MKFIILLIFVCSTFISQAYSESNKTGETAPFLLCETAKITYRNAGYKGDDIYSMEKDDMNLEVCSKKRTCCKAAAEKNLRSSSDEKWKILITPLHDVLKETFQDSASKFRAFFRSMMSESEKSLDSMFTKTYNTHYTNNAYVFKDLYKSLDQYINGSGLNLKMKFDTFFSNLHEKIYVMSKPWLSFDLKYKNCIRDKTHYIKPFGDKQKRISYQTTRAFEASRIFLQGLKEGMEVITKLLDIPVQKQCKNAFMKMTHCSVCSGVYPKTKPCEKYCLNVMKGCYAYIFMIQDRWSQYISAMINLAGKLEGPFNLEALVVPLGVKISEAIMTFQDNAKNITNKVEASCGKAQFLSNTQRKRRNIDEEKKDALLSLKTVSEQPVGAGDKFQSETQTIIDKLKSKSDGKLALPTFMKVGKGGREPSQFEVTLSFTKKKLNKLKDCWMMLPNTLCGTGLASDKNSNCWNGENTNGYTKEVVDSAVYNLFNSNPEMLLSNQESDSITILQQDNKLKLITAKLNSVIAGNGVNCVDCETNEGSGFNGNNDDDDDDKDNKTDKYGSGDGSGGGDPTPSGDGEGSGQSTPVVVTKSPTTPCHENDPLCFNIIKVKNDPNKVSEDPLPWPVRERKSSGTIKITNVLLLFVSLVFALTYHQV